MTTENVRGDLNSGGWGGGQHDKCVVAEDIQFLLGVQFVRKYRSTGINFIKMRQHTEP